MLALGNVAFAYSYSFILIEVCVCPLQPAPFLCGRCLWLMQLWLPAGPQLSSSERTHHSMHRSPSCGCQTGAHINAKVAQ